MKNKTLQPISFNKKIIEQIEAEIVEQLRESFFKPLIDILKVDQKIILNSSEDPIIQAIRDGRIYFSKGKFKGRFSAQTSSALKRLGATWDKKQGSFLILSSKLPSPILSAIKSSRAKFEESIGRLNKELKKISPEKIADTIKIEKLFDAQIFDIDKNLDKQLSNFTTYQRLTDKQRAEIAKNYTNNMKLYIKEWVEEEIVDLREKVKASTKEGMRYEQMIDSIAQSYNVSKSKAKFLARQETNLLNVEMQKERYLEAGIKKYKWVTVVGTSSHPVRPDHKKLDGKVFQWDKPPVVNDKGDRKNPGQDYNCRCRAHPVIEF